jgi:peptidoglycan/LPS O-acetylase OafA/YrhL
MRAQEATTGDRSYLDFIDGLRAIAILAVVAFHIGLPAPSGGFFGVDIFFVISGFLIIGQIVADCEAGTFRFGRFWARRVLRILPSYLLVILACVAASLVLLVTPKEASTFGEQVMMSAGFAMNSWLIRNLGYFGTAGDPTELLHLWSLAVEEQFYLVAPVVIAAFFLVTRWTGRWVPRPVFGAAALAAVCMWSFGLAMRTLPYPNFDIFYHTEHRIWEFMAGGIGAILVPRLRQLPAVSSELATASGLAGVAYGVFALGPASAFPSWQTLVPVVGAAALLGAGSARRTAVTGLLAWRPLRFIGLVSYAWYLWHWPLTSFAYIANFGDRSALLRAACAITSFGLAVLTYLLLERPLRPHRRELARRMPWRIVSIGLATCALTAGVGWAISTERAADLARTIPHGMAPALEEPEPRCDLTKLASADDCLAAKGNAPGVILLGDSNGTAAAKAFGEFARARGYWLLSAAIAGCGPFVDAGVVNRGAVNMACPTRLGNALRLLPSKGAGVSRAIIEAQWILHTYGVRPQDGELLQDDHAAFTTAVRHTLQLLRSIGVTEILVLAPIPDLPLAVPDCLIRADRTGVSRDACSMTKVAFEAQRATAMGWLDEVLADQPDVRLVDPAPAFCDDLWCRPYRGDVPYYVDTGHLDHAGEDALYGATLPGFDWLFEGAKP